MVNPTNQSSDMSFYVIMLAIIVAMAFYVFSDIKQRNDSKTERSTQTQTLQSIEPVVISIEQVRSPSTIEPKIETTQKVMAIKTVKQQLSPTIMTISEPQMAEIVPTTENIVIQPVVEARTQVLYATPAISVPNFKPVPVYGGYQYEQQRQPQNKPYREQHFRRSYQVYPTVPQAQYYDPYQNYQIIPKQERYYQLRQQNNQYQRYQHYQKYPAYKEQQGQLFQRY